MIYTALIGEVDNLRQPTTQDRYVAFFDGENPNWECVPPADLFKDPRRTARFHKVLMPESEYDHLLWIDANILPKYNLSFYVEMLGDADILTFRHTSRDCVYREAACIIGWGFDDPEIVKGQMARYLKEKYPEHNGLAETGFLLRKNNTAVKEFNRIWWEEICRGSKRDQLSFNYAVWKSGVKVQYIEDKVETSKYISYEQHAKDTRRNST